MEKKLDSLMKSVEGLQSSVAANQEVLKYLLGKAKENVENEVMEGTKIALCGLRWFKFN